MTSVVRQNLYPWMRDALRLAPGFVIHEKIDACERDSSTMIDCELVQASLTGNWPFIDGGA